VNYRKIEVMIKMSQDISGIISVKLRFYGLLLIGLLLSCNSEIYFEDAYCIQNVNVIDPLDGLKKGMNVVIKGNKIHQIGMVGALKLSPKNKIIEGTDKYLIPGLWDSHVHFYFDQQLALHMPELFLSNGITSVRDTGGACGQYSKKCIKASENPSKSKNCWPTHRWKF
jgi:urease alpha subunit